MDMFSQNDAEQAIYLEYEGDKNGNRVPDPEEIGIKYFKGDGDFRSRETIKLLKQADIVVTNPPFSLFREYVAQLIEYDKKFLIIGNVNAISYKETFKLVKENKIWLGASIHSGDREFGVPDDYPLKAAGYRIDSKGRKFIRVKGVRWFTNLDYKERHEDLILYKTYNSDEYPSYDNYSNSRFGCKKKRKSIEKAQDESMSTNGKRPDSKRRGDFWNRGAFNEVSRQRRQQSRKGTEARSTGIRYHRGSQNPKS